MDNNNIQFDEPGMAYNRPPVVARHSFPTQLLLKTGLVKDEQQAQYALAGIALLALVITFFMYSGAGNKVAPAPQIKNNKTGQVERTINKDNSVNNINELNDDLLNF